MVPSNDLLYEELGRLNNELVKLQRETFKKNVQTARLAAIVESSEEAIISVDLAWTFVSCNASAERLYEYAHREILGRTAMSLSLPWPANLIRDVLEPDMPL